MRLHAPSPKARCWPGPQAWRLAVWAGLLAGTLLAPAAPAPGTNRWWKGNLHTHSLWSDGDDYPEMVAAWYKEHGYHFLVLSDHNAVQQGAAWVRIGTEKARTTLARYLARFGSNWVTQQLTPDLHKVRLKTLAEYRKHFEERDRFLLLPGEEITDRLIEGEHVVPLHLNAVNLRTLVRPAGGLTVPDVLQRNLQVVLEQSRRTGQPMLASIAHPNFGWAITAEDLMAVPAARFFEVYNGHPAVRNQGDARHPDTERLWDLALAFRLGELGLGPLYGVAVDDAHQYHAFARTNAHPGRGWVQVRTPRLTAPALLAALAAGEFYASTGVRLREVRREPGRLTVWIEAEPGVAYTTRFLGTRRGFDPRSEPLPAADETERPVSRRYSPEIGAVLEEVRGPVAAYSLRGDELYVRATILSSKLKTNGLSAYETERAWVQPWVPGPGR